MGRLPSVVAGGVPRVRIERLGGALAGEVGGGTECRQDSLKDIQSASVVAFQSNKGRLAGVNDGS